MVTGPKWPDPKNMNHVRRLISLISRWFQRVDPTPVTIPFTAAEPTARSMGRPLAIGAAAAAISNTIYNSAEPHNRSGQHREWPRCRSYYQVEARSWT